MVSPQSALYYLDLIALICPLFYVLLDASSQKKGVFTMKLDMSAGPTFGITNITDACISASGFALPQVFAFGSRLWCQGADQLFCSTYDSASTTLSLTGWTWNCTTPLDLATLQIAKSINKCFSFGAGLTISITVMCPLIIYFSTERQCLKWTAPALAVLLYMISLLATAPYWMIVSSIVSLQRLPGAAARNVDIALGPLCYVALEMLVRQVIYTCVMPVVCIRKMVAVRVEGTTAG